MVSGLGLGSNEAPTEEMPVHYVMLDKDRRPICRTRCTNLPFEPSKSWSIVEFRPKAYYFELTGLYCQLYPEPQRLSQRREWDVFTDWLVNNQMVAIVISESCKFYILPPEEWKDNLHVEVMYRMRDEYVISKYREVGTPGYIESKYFTSSIERPMKVSKSDENYSHALKLSTTDVDSFPREYVAEPTSRCHPTAPMDDCGRKASVHTSPSYLKTLGQAHSWAFGAIAELVDNSKDSGASRLDISVEYLHLKSAGRKIPVLGFIDDGHGMSHNEILRMLSIGHRQPDREDSTHIGRFGVGFKTGAMKLGRDAIILTQTSSSRSVALLSQTYNENKENLAIPIVTYHRSGNYMEFDLTIQSEAAAHNYLKEIRDCSPFNEYVIGGKFALFDEGVTGTHIYIWNLEEWGSEFTLEWDGTKTVAGSSCESYCDILIRSRRLRSRVGQISRKVPLDYSLRAYLEVIFLDPRMKIYVHGSLVESRPLAKTLRRSVVIKGDIIGKPLQLTLGRSRDEWEEMNCGIFLYWHGRLIEAYKRVGGMVHNADKGRGVIGVLDVSNIMNDGNGHVWVMHNKQGFQDCEVYTKLVEWLGVKVDEYLDENFETLDLRKGKKTDMLGHKWIQCNKCRKRRMLRIEFDTKTLPREWLCYMPPFYGKCGAPEQEVEPGDITVSTKRTWGDTQEARLQCEAIEVGDKNYSWTEIYSRYDRQSARSRQRKSVRIDITATQDKKGSRWSSRPSANHNKSDEGYDRQNSRDARITYKESPP